MPSYKTHQLFGFGLALFLFMVSTQFGLGLVPSNPTQFLIAMGVILFYSILADMDIGTSVSRKIILGGGLLLLIYCFLTGMAALGVVTCGVLLAMTFLLTHRGRTHTIAAAGLFSVPLLYMGWHVALLGIISYISHLFIDGEMKLVK